jgi:subtilisin family serine protease
VGAVDVVPTRVAAFSDRRAVDVFAPGVGLTTLFPTQNSPYVVPSDCAFVGTTACWSTGEGTPWGATGTSFAAAMVTGAASLLFAARPQLHADQVSAALERTAVDVGRGGGFGLVQVAAALRRLG